MTSDLDSRDYSGLAENKEGVEIRTHTKKRERQIHMNRYFLT